MLFAETLGPDDLPLLQDEKPDTAPQKVDTTTLYQHCDDPVAKIRSRFEFLVDHIVSIEEQRDRQKVEEGFPPRQVSRAVIRDRILNALRLGTITMDVTPGNRVTRTSFAPRQITPEERVFGVFAEEEVVAQDPRAAPGRRTKRTTTLSHVQTSPTPLMEHGPEDGMTGLA